MTKIGAVGMNIDSNLNSVPPYNPFQTVFQNQKKQKQAEKEKQHAQALEAHHQDAQKRRALVRRMHGADMYIPMDLVKSEDIQGEKAQIIDRKL